MSVIDVSHSGHYVGDCRELLKQLPDGCVQTCVTSPPYWGLRDYGVDGQLGLEQSPHEYVANMVGVFCEVRRVLRDDGTLWLNLGDSYAAAAGGGQGKNSRFLDRAASRIGVREQKRSKVVAELKPKDLVGIPWLVAFALREDGWYLRSDIIWAKPNPMPESVADRPTKAHEYLFLLSKSERYFYDHLSIREPEVAETAARYRYVATDGRMSQSGAYREAFDDDNDHGLLSRARTGNPMPPTDGKRNKRTVWTVSTQPYDGAHFATFPPALIEPCILAGSRGGDIVLDPFFGSGTTGMVAEKHGRRWIGFDLNPEYEKLQKERTAQRSLVLGGSA